MTGHAVRSEVTARNKNGLATLPTDAEGRGNYQLSSGRNDLEIGAVGHKKLATHFEPDAQSVKNVTVWVDPLEPPDELRPEVIAPKVRSGQSLLHGHVFDSETGQPVKGARVHLECAAVEAQTNDRGYFLFYAPVLSINPTEDLPSTDNLIVDLKGFKAYRRVNVPITEGATHFIIDLSRGEGVSERDDTHKLMRSPEQLRNTQTENPDLDQQTARENLGTHEGDAQPLSLTVPTSIRVGSNCPSKTTCSTFNVYSLDTYVKNGLDDEWISSWHAESLKAGAIAYRSYGVYHVYHPLSANYDICNTTSCQVNDPSDSSSRTSSATDNTTGIIVVDSSGNNPFFAEYAAENNDNFCADGFTGSPSANWPCLSDPVDAGQTFNGHGRGMCQWGTQRWAVNQGQGYVWIVNHYYNNNGNPSGARSGVLQTPAPNVVQFSVPSYQVVEGCAPAAITVTRSGDTSGVATVNFATSDGTASQRTDYTLSAGTVTFNAGEDTKTFNVLITEDNYAEGTESLDLTLTNPSGGFSLGVQSMATLQIFDNLNPHGSQPIDDAGVFVCQHYHDFLTRQADSGGLAFWTNEITSCGTDQACIEVKRINVSASFFLSIEFQQTGYLVERLYKVAYGNAVGTSTLGGMHQLPVPIVRFDEFLRDTQRIAQGVVVLQPGWETVLENNKQAYALEFVQTNRFIAAFPTSMTPTQFVDALNTNAGNVLSASEKTTAVSFFGGAGNTTNTSARAQAVRQVAEDADLNAAEFNRAFVLAEYFGYLRRNPNDAPEASLDYTGFEFWLNKLDQFNGNYISAEMVKAFLSSIEYRQRFGAN